MYEINKGIPIPPIDRTPKVDRRKYPLDTMDVGDQIFVPGREPRSLSAYISRISKGLQGRRFTVRAATMKRVNGQWVEAGPDEQGAKEGAGLWRIE